MIDKIKLFEACEVRTHWDAEQEKWYFSIVDVLAVLTESLDPAAYWRKLKQRLKAEGNQSVTNCHALKMRAADGRSRLTDVADTEQLLRFIQSVPSPKAEPLKQWLAAVGYERIEETEDPELALDRAKITRAWAGLDTRQYKALKTLKKENLRDHMSNMELVLNMLAEATTTEISRQKLPEGFEQNRKVAKEGGTIAGDTRKAIEAQTGIAHTPYLSPEACAMSQRSMANLHSMAAGIHQELAMSLRNTDEITSRFLVSRRSGFNPTCRAEARPTAKALTPPKEALINSSSPRSRHTRDSASRRARRGSSILVFMDSRLRGNDKIV